MSLELTLSYKTLKYISSLNIESFLVSNLKENLQFLKKTYQSLSIEETGRQFISDFLFSLNEYNDDNSLTDRIMGLVLYDRITSTLTKLLIS